MIERFFIFGAIFLIVMFFTANLVIALLLAIVAVIMTL